MKQRLSQAKLLRAQRALARLIAAVHDARVRYSQCVSLRPRRLCGLSRVLKQLAALPHTADYSGYEAELKRRLIRAQRRLHGYRRHADAQVFALAQELPVVYQRQVEAFDQELCRLLESLADVPVRASAAQT